MRRLIQRLGAGPKAEATFCVTLMFLWLCFPGARGLAATASDPDTVMLFWGWTLDKKISVQGLVIGIPLLWQFSRATRQALVKLTDLPRRLDAIEKRLNELACVKGACPEE